MHASSFYSMPFICIISSTNCWHDSQIMKKLLLLSIALTQLVPGMCLLIHSISETRVFVKASL